MPRYELSISPDYVPNWTELDAVREIFQNALDQQSIDPVNRMSWGFSKEDECFWISSRQSKLTKDSLLFGVSSKANDVKTIGMFGEGYKLALLVLTRLGYDVVINNYSENEIWKPKIINSRRYGSKILVIDIEKKRWVKPPDENLTFMITGTHAGIIADIGMSNLHMKVPKKVIQTDYGRILMGKRHVSKVYINGLFVSVKPGFEYGYDIKPEYLTIGRDRNLIGDFDLSWITSKMWAQATGHPLLASKMVYNESPDVSYINSFTSDEGELAKTMEAEFKGTYGKIAIPVSSQEEHDIVKASYKKVKPIIVKELVKTILCGYSSKTIEKAPKKKDTRQPSEILHDFRKKISARIYGKDLNEFDRIIKKSHDWTFK